MPTTIEFKQVDWMCPNCKTENEVGYVQCMECDTEYEAIKKKKEKMIEVEIELLYDTYYKLLEMAHEQDITFNQLCSKILKEVIDNEKV